MRERARRSESGRSSAFQPPKRLTHRRAPRTLAWAIGGGLLLTFCPLAYGLGALISWLSPLADDPLQVEDDR